MKTNVKKKADKTNETLETKETSVEAKESVFLVVRRKTLEKLVEAMGNYYINQLGSLYMNPADGSYYQSFLGYQTKVPQKPERPPIPTARPVVRGPTVSSITKAKVAPPGDAVAALSHFK